MDGLTYALALAAGLRRAIRIYAREALYAAAAAVPHPGWYRGRRRVRRGQMSTLDMVAHHANARAAAALSLRRVTEERSLVPAQMRRWLEMEPIL